MPLRPDLLVLRTQHFDQSMYAVGLCLKHCIWRVQAIFDNRLERQRLYAPDLVLRKERGE
jgi:hypothetical protein